MHFRFNTRELQPLRATSKISTPGSVFDLRPLRGDEGGNPRIRARVRSAAASSGRRSGGAFACWAGLAASGWHVCAMAMRMFADSISRQGGIARRRRRRGVPLDQARAARATCCGVEVEVLQDGAASPPCGRLRHLPLGCVQSDANRWRASSTDAHVREARAKHDRALLGRCRDRRTAGARATTPSPEDEIIRFARKYDPQAFPHRSGGGGAIRCSAASSRAAGIRWRSG